MFCPKCGAEGQSARAYCKRCGEWLPDLRASARAEFGGASPEENARMMLVMSALSSVFALFAAAALYATHLGRAGVSWSVYFAAAFCLVIAAWQLSNFLIGIKLLKRLRKGREAPAAEDEPVSVAGRAAERHALGAGERTQFTGAGGVTEGTTRTLEPVPGRDERRDQRR